MDKLGLIRECLADKSLTPLSQIVVVNCIANPAKVTQADIEWAKTVFSKATHGPSR